MGACGCLPIVVDDLRPKPSLAQRRFVGRRPGQANWRPLFHVFFTPEFSGDDDGERERERETLPLISHLILQSFLFIGSGESWVVARLRRNTVAMVTDGRGGGGASANFESSRNCLLVIYFIYAAVGASGRQGKKKSLLLLLLVD